MKLVAKLVADTISLAMTAEKDGHILVCKVVQDEDQGRVIQRRQALVQRKNAGTRPDRHGDQHTLALPV
jgi:hypothetical protein